MVQLSIKIILWRKNSNLNELENNLIWFLYWKLGPMPKMRKYLLTTDFYEFLGTTEWFLCTGDIHRVLN